MIHNKFAAKETQGVMRRSYLKKNPKHYRVCGDSFVQFVYDNADHESTTNNGHGTFHVLGGIMCVTPSSYVIYNKKIPRVKTNSLDAGRNRSQY